MAYARPIRFFNKTGKKDIVIPLSYGDWNGSFEGENFEDQSSGIGDLRLRASINLTGGSVLNKTQFKNFKQKTVSGLSVQVTIPTGNYQSNQ